MSRGARPRRDRLLEGGSGRRRGGRGGPWVLGGVDRRVVEGSQASSVCSSRAAYVRTSMPWAGESGGGQAAPRGPLLPSSQQSRWLPPPGADSSAADGLAGHPGCHQGPPGPVVGVLLPPQDGPADIAALAQGEPAGGRRRWVHGSSMGRAAPVGAALGVGCRLAHGTSARASLVLAAAQSCAPLRACAVLRVCARPHVYSNMCSIIGHVSRHGIGQGSEDPCPMRSAGWNGSSCPPGGTRPGRLTAVGGEDSPSGPASRTSGQPPPRSRDDHDCSGGPPPFFGPPMKPPSGTAVTRSGAGTVVGAAGSSPSRVTRSGDVRPAWRRCRVDSCGAVPGTQRDHPRSAGPPSARTPRHRVPGRHHGGSPHLVAGSCSGAPRRCRCGGCTSHSTGCRPS